MLRAFKIPISWKELFIRTANEVMADNCLNLAAQLAYYFFLALFPALLVLLAIISFFPVHDLMNTIVATLGRVAPGEVLDIVRDQITKIANGNKGGLLTVGVLGAVWSSSSAITAIVSALNEAYDIQEARPWWKVRIIAIGLTVALAIFIVIATALVLVGPTLAEKVAAWFHLGGVFEWTWKIVQWPLVFVLVSLAVAVVFYFAPDAVQEFVWITPGSVFATALWLLVSLGFKFYVQNFTSYNATYGAIGGVIVLMLWFYVSSLALLVGAELNSEIEHASPYGKDPGEKAPGEKTKIGAVAEREWEQQKASGAFKPALSPVNCDVDAELPAAVPAGPPPPRASDWILSGVVLGEAAALAWFKLRSRFKRIGG
ncbi:MAG TPA: YihY/virulence factor BrkB family protein [Vicinamibacterales bacterium]|nr:YihY/virulence factor BrkB family protein [Vicinamibacterales bacterium]